MNKIFFFLTLFTLVGVASAEEQIQLTDQNGNPIILTRQQVQTISEPAGTYIHGTATDGQVVTSTMQNFVESMDYSGTTTFSGEVGTTQATLQIGDATILVEPEKQDFPLNITEIIIIGLGGAVAIGAIIVRRRG